MGCGIEESRESERAEKRVGEKRVKIFQFFRLPSDEVMEINLCSLPIKGKEGVVVLGCTISLSLLGKELLMF